MPRFIIKRSDTLPAVEAELLINNSPVNLTGMSVKFFAKSLFTDKEFGGDAVIVDAVKGQVRYDLQADDTDDAGDYRGEFQVTAGDQVMSFPNDGYIDIKIIEDIGD